MNELLRLYKAEKSKDNKYLKLTLVGGENENKKFYNCLLGTDGKSKTQVMFDETIAHIITPLVKYEPKEAETDKADDLPF